MTLPYPPVSDLLPHRPPMLLIDELLEAGDEYAVVRVSITERSLFLADGAVPAIVTLEYMAQASAAFIGFDDRRLGRPIQAGFLLSCRRATFAVDSLAPGDELRVEARRSWTDGQLAQFDCTVERQGQQLAAATLGVVRSESGSSSQEERSSKS